MKNDKRKKNIRWTKNHRGEDVLELSVHWKDGKRYRRYMPNMTVANKTLARIKAANIDGTWPELRKQLAAHQPAPEVESQPKAGDLSIEELTRVYYEEWCLSRHDAPEADKKQLKTIVRILGERRLQSFERDDASAYFRIRHRQEKVSVCTASKGLTVLSGMLRFAWKEKKWIPAHPMEDFKWPTVPRKTRTDLEPIEVRRIVEEAMNIDDVVGRLIGIMSETGMRIGEMLNLKRRFFEVRNRQVIVAPWKKHPERQVPLSPWAIELAAGLPVVFASEFMFVHLKAKPGGRADCGQRLGRKAVCSVLEQARKAAGISWWQEGPTPHDFRHFRAVTWLENGVDIDKVREWMGHTNIKTTQIYLGYVKHRATAAFDEANQREQEKLRMAAKASARSEMELEKNRIQN